MEACVHYAPRLHKPYPARSTPYQTTKALPVSSLLQSRVVKPKLRVALAQKCSKPIDLNVATSCNLFLHVCWQRMRPTAPFFTLARSPLTSC